MLRHRWLHAGGVVFVLAVVLATLQDLYRQSPVVDLRLMPSKPLAQPALPASAPTPALVDSICQFSALRGVLDDLQSRVRYLQSETMFLERDANSLWSGWKSVFGVQRDAPNAIALSQPWHWTYMVTDKPRPTLHYDFDLRYDQELENARRDNADRAAKRLGEPRAESWRTVPSPPVPKAVAPTRASGPQP